MKNQVFATLYKDSKPPNAAKHRFKHFFHHTCVKPRGFLPFWQIPTKTVDSLTNTETDERREKREERRETGREREIDKN